MQTNFSEYEELVDKWELTELLLDCKDLSEKIQLSNILEETVDNLFLNDDESKKFQIKASIMIPLVVRLFREGINNIEYDKLSDVIDNLYSIFNDLTKDSYNLIDGEMEFILLCQDEYIHLYGINNE